VDREIVLAGLVLTTVGATLFVTAPWPGRAHIAASARDCEQACWRRLWLPVIPAILVVSVLIGWALVEPSESDEPLPWSALIISAIFAVVWIRAAARAVRSWLMDPPRTAGTVGFWRPRIIVSPQLARAVDPTALSAVFAHETAHARHRDPLRIWLAQIATDVQWPWPAARERFRRWRRVLELARDEEARLSGADGADLASAVLAATRMQMTVCAGASLIDDERDLQDRIARLLAPIPSRASAAAFPATALLPLPVLGVLSGVRFGEILVQALVKIL
jgi:hypothetical protein